MLSDLVNTYFEFPKVADCIPIVTGFGTKTEGGLLTCDTFTPLYTGTSDVDLKLGLHGKYELLAKNNKPGGYTANICVKFMISFESGMKEQLLTVTSVDDATV